MPDTNGSVEVSKRHIALLTGALFIVLSAVSTWLVAYQASLSKDIRNLSERVVRLETLHGMDSPDGG